MFRGAFTDSCNMVDHRICLEALSALSGCNVEETAVSSAIGPQDLVNVVALREFYRQAGFQELEYPSIGSISVHDSIDMYSSPPAVTAGPPNPPTTTIGINPKDFFDHQFDYDFTKVNDGDKTFLRGNEKYVRPCGWNRVALLVTNKYSDGDNWLGTGANAWPVSYQGHNMDGPLIGTMMGDPNDQPAGLLDACAASIATPITRAKGAYSTPDIKMAEQYCKKFKSKVDGKTYKVVLQNRINPEKRQNCQRENVWVVFIPDGSTDIERKTIVQNSIRPYGLLLKQE